MKYKNLNDLVLHSSSSRKYLLSLPVQMQMQVHKYGKYIHTAADLHNHAEMLQKYNNSVEISNMLL